MSEPTKHPKSFYYHPELAPTGKLFKDADIPGLPEGWVDTPAKFPKNEPPVNPLNADVAPPKKVTKRRTKKKVAKKRAKK